MNNLNSYNFSVGIQGNSLAYCKLTYNTEGQPIDLIQ